MKKGYHILLEKPITQTWKECRDILWRAPGKRVIVGVCHVLRYHPAFVQMKASIDAGAVGEIVNIRHEESVSIERMPHAFFGEYGNGRGKPLR